MGTKIVLLVAAGLLLSACGGSDSAEPSASSTTASPTTSATPSALQQGFPEGSRYWTFQDGPNVWAAYTERTGQQLCLIRFYPEYYVDRGTVTDGAAEQLLDMDARPATMVSTGRDAYSATVTGDPNAALTVTAPTFTEVFLPTDMSGAAEAIEASLPTADGMSAVADITPACAEPAGSTPSATPTSAPPLTAPAGFAEGLQYWTTDSASVGAFSRRTGSAMCLAVLYPESRPDVGTVVDVPGGQEFAIEAKPGGVLFDPQPAQTALVTGDPSSGLELAYSGGSVRYLAPSNETEVAAILAATYPGSDGMTLLTNNLQACP